MATKKLKKVIINGESYNLPNNSDFVDLTSAQSVGGVKTFTSAPVVPNKTSDATNTGTAIATEAQVYKKQDTLIAGDNITIANDGKTISATDTTYTAGTGIDITNGVISNTQTSAEWGNITGTLSDQEDLNTALGGKQDTLIAGSNISIANDGKTISATDTTYSASDFDIKDLTDSTGLRTTWSGKQDALTQGSNITITTSGGTTTISATDTTYSEVSKSDMDTGTGTTAGVVSAKSIADYVSGRVSSTYRYKGTKSTYGDLPSSGNVVGDVWNVETAHTTAPKFPAGSNLAWDGTGWDVLGGVFDTSDFVDKTSAQTISGVKTFSAEPVLPSKTSSATNNGTKPATEAQVYKKQDTLTAGTNITISSNTISAKGDMAYSDFNWVTKTGATITMDLCSTITPSANFTVNAPSTIQEGQEYVLRVTNGSTAYTMTLGTNITNPFSQDLTLNANATDQFVFLGVGGKLELRPEMALDSNVVKTSGNQTINGTKTFGTSPVVPSKTASATNTGTAIATEAQVYSVASSLSTLDGNVVKLSGNQTIAGTKTFSTSPVVPSKTSDATNSGTAIATEAQVYKKLDSSSLGNATITYKQGISDTAIGTITTNQSSNGTITFHDNVVKTQTEYDNLPASKSTDGNSYWIYETVS